jgi:hypothetical protein
LNELVEADGPTDLPICKMGLEGLVSKRKDSPYRSGRSPDWLKMKNPNAPAVKRPRLSGSSPSVRTASPGNQKSFAIEQLAATIIPQIRNSLPLALFEFGYLARG